MDRRSPADARSPLEWAAAPGASFKAGLGWLRWAWAAAVTVWLGIFAGQCIWSGGYGGWVLWIVSMFLCPLVVSVLAPRAEFLFGGMVNVIVILSLARTRYLWMSDRSDRPWEWFAGSLHIDVVIGAINFAVGVGVGLMIGALRRERSRMPLPTHAVDR